MTVAGFRCVVIHVKHSVTSCVARHEARVDPLCKGCPVGAAHAAGRLPTHWPPERGGGPVVRLEVVPFDRIPPRRRRAQPAA